MTKAKLGWVLSHSTIKVEMMGLATGMLWRGRERSRKAGLSDETRVFVFDKDVNQSEAKTQPSHAA